MLNPEDAQAASPSTAPPSPWHGDHAAPCTVRAQRALIVLGVRRGRMRRGGQAVGLCSLPPVSARGQSQMPALPTAWVSPPGGLQPPAHPNREARTSYAQRARSGSGSPQPVCKAGPPLAPQEHFHPFLAQPHRRHLLSPLSPPGGLSGPADACQLAATIPSPRLRDGKGSCFTSPSPSTLTARLLGQVLTGSTQDVGV